MASVGWKGLTSLTAIQRGPGFDCRLCQGIFPLLCDLGVKCNSGLRCHLSCVSQLSLVEVLNSIDHKFGDVYPRVIYAHSV